MLYSILCVAALALPDTRLYEKQAAAGEWSQAAETARRLEAAAAAKAPLEIVDLELLGAPPQGLGMYSPLPDAKARGSEIYLYAQVRNHGLREVHGFYELHLVSELVIYDRTGAELARDKAFGESRFTARVPHRDTFVVIAIRTAGLPSGDYRFELILHDRIGHKSGRGDVRLIVP